MAEDHTLEDKPKYLIAVGASAGGINALIEFIAQLDERIDAAICVVLHLSKTGGTVSGFLAHRMQQYTAMQCVVARDGMPIKRGSIYIAPADNHLIVGSNTIIIGTGPKENRWRPSIDVLFRSAGAAFGEAAIGVILTGMLDDGVAGMIAIQKCGGATIVQDPAEAEHPEMPLAVLNNIEVDQCIKLGHMGAAIRDIIQFRQFQGIEVPAQIKAEAGISERMATGIDVVAQIAGQSVYTCPDCGGGLWEINEHGFHRYRCNIGHAYSETELIRQQAEELESTLWIALRMMEERNHLLKKIAAQEGAKGLSLLAESHLSDATALEGHIANIKDLLFKARGHEVKNNNDAQHRLIV